MYNPPDLIYRQDEFVELIGKKPIEVASIDDGFRIAYPSMSGVFYFQVAYHRAPRNWWDRDGEYLEFTSFGLEDLTVDPEYHQHHGEDPIRSNEVALVIQPFLDFIEKWPFISESSEQTTDDYMYVMTLLVKAASKNEYLNLFCRFVQHLHKAGRITNHFLRPATEIGVLKGIQRDEIVAAMRRVRRSHEIATMMAE